jgi:hypothetical protein
MVDDIRDGHVDAVLCYHIDRLTRRPIEFEEFAQILQEAGVTNVRFASGDINLGTDDGLLIGRFLAAAAAHESGRKSARQKRKAEQVAAEGRPNGGPRPFGFEDDRITHRPNEVALIRQLVDRFLAGESTRSLTTWISEQGVPSAQSGEWRTGAVITILTNPRIAGLRAHRGVVVGPAVWDPIISEDQHHQILSRMAAKRISGRRSPRRYLLSGMLRCGKCDVRLYSAARQTTRRYVCMAGPDHGGCGRLTVVAAPLEELLAEAVLIRLDTPDLAAAISGAELRNELTASLHEAVSADTDKLGELSTAYADSKISMPEWLDARRKIVERLDANQRKIRKQSHNSELSAILGQGVELRTQWGSLNLARQRAIVEALLDHAVIGAGVSGARSLDPDRVQPYWRL